MVRGDASPVGSNSRMAAAAGRLAAVYPLTPMQQGMLFHSLLHPGGGSYVVQLLLSLDGPLDRAAMRNAWQAVIDRHPVLRTAFSWERRERPLQAVLTHARVPWAEADWSGLDAAAQAICQCELLAADRRRGFDLKRAPLLRVSLLRLGRDRHLMLWSVHHLLLDGWSSALVLDDLARSYAALRQGEAPRLAPSRPFEDFVRWLERRDAAASESFWRRELAGPAGAVQLHLRTATAATGATAAIAATAATAASAAEGAAAALTPATTARSGQPGASAPAAPPALAQRDSRAAAGTAACGEVTRELPAGATAALRELAAACRLTESAVVLGAFCVLLSRYGRTSRVTIGVTVAGRPPELSGVESMVGLFINTLPLAVEIDEAAPAAGWLSRLQARSAALHGHAASALPEVRQWAGLAAEQPLFEQIFVFENYPDAPGAAPDLGGLRLGEISALEQPDHPLTLVAAPGPRLRLRALFDRARFTAAPVALLLGHLEELLRQMAAAPWAPLGALDMLGAAERQAILAAGRGAPRPYPRETGLAALFAVQAAHRGDAPAVLDGAVHLSYRQLAERATALAGRLLAMGVHPGDRVAVLLERGADFVVAILAILECGAAYVPLDPTHPSERLAYMLGDCQARALIVAESTALARLPGGVPDPNVVAAEATSVASGADVVVADTSGVALEIDAVGATTGSAVPSTGGVADLPLPPGCLLLQLRSWQAEIGPDGAGVSCGASGATGVCGAAAGAGEIAFRRSPEGLSAGEAGGAPGGLAAAGLPGGEAAAYLMYTSGSTGRPKGAVVTQRAVARLVLGADYLELPPTPRVAFASNVSFDASTLEIWAALLHGGTLVTVDRETLLAPPALRALLRGAALDLVWLTAGWFNELARQVPDVFAGTGTLICGGEAVDAGAVRAVLAAGAPRRLLDGYGPTENTTFTTTYDTAALAAGAATVPIGRPIANSEAFVLDHQLRLLPAGAAGELCTGGDGLAMGYHGRPDLSAERFVPHPFAERPGERLYRTGDLAWLGEGGNLEILGRLDSQLKIRGFRVEPGEVEVLLAQHPGVERSVVVARGGGALDRRLVAYVVGSGLPPAAALRAWLAQRLPEHMVPAAVVELPALPLTPHGKVDRGALPSPAAAASAPGSALASAAAGAAAPPPSIELLAGIWEQVLGVSAVGAGDDFFARGGHSLLATVAVSRIRAAFGVELPLHEIFDAPVLRHLAERIDAARRRRDSTPGGAPAPAISPARRDRPLPLSFAQERLWFLDRFAPLSAAYHIPHALRLHGDLETAALRLALQEIVRRHEALRTVFTAVEGQPRQRVLPSRPVPLPLADLAALGEAAREAELGRHLERQFETPFDLARGPLLRQLLVRLDERHHVLSLVLHHIVADGWSVGLFAAELAALYGALRQPDLPPAPVLPELPVQYADFAVWQRTWLSGDVLENQLGYWQERLQGLAGVQLPADRRRPPAQSFRGGSLAVELPVEVAAAAAGLARREDCTLFMVLLAAFLVLLQRYTDQDDLVVGAPVANRTEAEIEPLIGFFVNMLPLRANLAGEPSFARLLAQVRALALDAFDHQHVPLAMLVERLRPVRDPSRQPLFQITFAVDDLPGGDITLPDLTLGEVRSDLSWVRFDVELHLWRQGGGMRGYWAFATDLFDAATVARFDRHYARLLASALAAPERRIASLAMLAEEERRQLLYGHNATAADFAAAAPVHAAVLRRAASHPDLPAVILDAEVLTCGDLARRAHLLAWHLLRCGVTPESRVGLLLERSFDLVTAMLATLLAGAAYVPLDPTYPRARLADLLHGAAPVLVLSHRHLAAGLALEAAAASPGMPGTAAPHAPNVVASPGPAVPAGTARAAAAGGECRLLELDRLPPLAEPPAGAVWPASLPLQAAYLIFTSGSTGTPKGVIVSHAALANHMAWMQERFPLRAGDRVLQKTGVTFDASVWELWAPLLAGTPLVLARPGLHADPRYLVEALAEQRITTLQMVPSVLELLVAAPGLEACASLRRVFVGGEAMTWPLAHRLRRRLAVEVVNLYGPAEATVDATYAVWLHGPGAPRQDAASIADTADTGDGADRPGSVGKPIANLRSYVLDRRLEPLPTGVPGEICLAGAGLARGYLLRPAETAARFLPDPHGGEPGARLYRTGDLARLLADGQIEYLGRLDRQVKIRGQRVELEEIEQHLAALPEVAAAVVQLRPAGGGEKRLVAYVVPADESAVPAAAVAAPPAAASAPSAAAAAEMARVAEPADESAVQAAAAAARPAEPEPASAAEPAAEPASERDRERARVEQWRSLYDGIYGGKAAADPTFDTTGWDSSYSGDPLPAEEMRRWRDATVERILALRPRRVLEIGCGTGLILFAVAPHAERYLAMDFSPAAMARLGAVVAARGLRQVELLQRQADDLAGLPGGAFDTVILNSVVQYFPSLDYLLHVLRQAIALTAPGGAIFLGDLRSLPLLGAFHASVQLHQHRGAPPATLLADLALRVEGQRRREEELVLDPALFPELRGHLPRLRGVSTQIKRGGDGNELTRFRYDVILRLDADRPAPTAEARVLDGGAATFSAAGLGRLLAAERPARVRVTRLANPRLRRDLRVQACLSSAAASLADSALLPGSAPLTLGELRALLGEPAAASTTTSTGASATDAPIAENESGPTTSPGTFTRAPTTGAPIAAADPIAPAGAAAPEGAGGEPDPEIFWRLGEALGYEVEVGWAPDGAGGELEVRMADRSAIPPAGAVADVVAPPRLPRCAGAATPLPALAALANDPLRGRWSRLLVPRLRRRLEQRLPAYMVPQAIVCLEALPLTANGKVDRAALPEPDREGLVSRASYARPATATERRLAEIWSGLLEVERISLHDDFFALGGHSLMAVMLAAAIHSDLGVAMPVPKLFELTNLAAQARYVDQCAGAAAPPVVAGSAAPAPVVGGGLVARLNGSDQAPRVFCFPPLLGYGAAFLGLGRRLASHALWAFDFAAADPDPLARYAALVDDLQPAGNLLFLGYSAGGPVALEVAKILERRGRRVTDLILLDAAVVDGRVELGAGERAALVEENLAYFEGFIRADPELHGRFLGGAARAALAAQMHAYMLFLDGLEHHGTAAANVHLIRAAAPGAPGPPGSAGNDGNDRSDGREGGDDPDGRDGRQEDAAAGRRDWRRLVTGEVRVYQGAGRHEDMVSDAHVDANAALLAAILAGLAARSPGAAAPPLPTAIAGARGTSSDDPGART
jgi:amino acid adenylation domain-containing protein